MNLFDVKSSGLFLQRFNLRRMRCKDLRLMEYKKINYFCKLFKLWSAVAERSSALDSSFDVVRMWVRIPAWSVAALVKEKGLAPVFLDSRLEHPAGWICARYKSSVLLLLLHYQCSTKSSFYSHV